MKKIKYMILAVSAALAAIACSVQEQEKEPPKTSNPADAPQIVSTYPVADDISSEVVGEIVITYDDDIVLAPNTTISVNGVYCDADVYAVDKQLFIPVTLKGGTQYTLKVTSPSVKDADGNYAADFQMTFTTVVRNRFDAASFDIADAPCDPEATPEARALYNLLKENFGKKTFSAAMAYVDWNSREADTLFQFTGKYPAINAFDYVHLPDSPGEWIDYSDITPVKSWHDRGGIVASGWHWRVPTANPNAGAEETTIEFPDFVTGAWANAKSLTLDSWNWFSDQDCKKAMDAFAASRIGTTVTIYYRGDPGCQMKIATHSWATMPSADGTDYSYFAVPEGDSKWVFTIDEANVDEIKSQGMIIGGSGITLYKVKISTLSNSIDFTIDFPDVETGNWSGSQVLANEFSWGWANEYCQPAMEAFATMRVGSKVVFNYIDAADGAQMGLKKSDWSSLKDNADTDYGYFTIPTGAGSYTLDVDETILDELKRNGMIIGGCFYTLTSVFVTTPLEQEITYSFYSQANDFTPAGAVNADSWENAFINADLDEMAANLKLLQDAGIAVLFRPLHEASGKWFWWGSGSDADYVALWRYVYDYLTGKGIHNLIWVWTSQTDDPSWYPGDEYVDVIGVDWYPQDAALYHGSYLEGWNAVLGISNKKMLAMSECGPVPYPLTCLEEGAVWSWAMPWYGSHMHEPYNSIEDFKTFMSSPYVITLDSIKP